MGHDRTGAPGEAGVVEGEIRFPPDARIIAGATARVSLLDVSRADAAARVVAEEVIPGVTHPGGGGVPIPFTLRAQQVDPRARYVVRAHVDVDGNGRISPGDYISTQSYPVTFDSNRVVISL